MAGGTRLLRIPGVSHQAPKVDQSTRLSTDLAVAAVSKNSGTAGHPSPRLRRHSGIAAIFARKSTDPGVVDAEKPVPHQVEQAKAYAARQGWVVDERNIFVDDGVSGAEFVKRPGLIRLLGLLTPRAPFQRLIMSEESRPGREQIEWWPQRDSNPCSRAAPRFCRCINDLGA
jgi:hypothetical protein